jgi:trimethylamine--corrinoid protein Co-methyltransferase
VTRDHNRPEEGEHATTAQMVRPLLSVLPPEQVEQIHRESLHLLSTVGVRIDSERARQLFARALGTALDPTDPVRLPPELVEWALQSAPNTVDLFDRTGTEAFRLPGPARFGVGVTALYYQDPQTDHVAPFARRHMEAAVRLAGALPSFDVVSTVGVLRDVPPHAADLYATLEMTANTTKPLVILVSDEEAFPAVLNLLEHLHGDLAARPFAVPYVNPITPFVINRGTVDKVWWAIERGLPIIYSNYGMAGATTPLAAAGRLVLLNAELLAGLTLSQLIRQGTPILLGSLPAVFDMRGMGSFYEPLSYLVDLACAEMMAHYRLPHCGTSGSGMGWGPDLIAAGHQWFNHLVSCSSKVGLAPFVGDNLGSKAFSPAIIVLADEVIEQVRAFARGFALDQAAIASHEIAEAGPGGSFLLSPSTLRDFRTAHTGSRIFPRLTLEEWQRREEPRAEECLRQHTRRLLETASSPADRDELMGKGEAFIQQWASRGL